MPVPASDAIASDIGHGALGLRENLCRLTDLLDLSSGQRHLWVEARPAKLLTGWSIHNASTATWCHGLEETFDDRRLDVVGVRCGSEVLTRVQTLASCEATAGTFYYEPDVAGTTIAWDDGVTTWDSGAKWDQDPILYVHRAAGDSPNDDDTVAQLGVFWGSHGVYQPTMSRDILTDGGLEVWASATDLTNWTETALGTGGGTVNRDATDKAAGSYSCRLAGTIDVPFNASGGKGIAQGSLAGVGGARYRVAGYYRTGESNAAGLEARLRIGYAGSYLEIDGAMTTAGTTGFVIADTFGYWRRFAFDFFCPGDTAALEVLAFAYNSSGGTVVGSVWFDGLSLRRIHRFEFYEPRLTMGGLPAVEQGRPDGSPWWEPMTTSLGTLSVASGDGLLEQLFALYDWIGAEVILRTGGKLPNGGNEILADDLFVAFLGIADAPEVEDGTVSLTLSDARVAFQQKVPRRAYEDGRFKPLPLGFSLGGGGKDWTGDWVYQGIVPQLVKIGGGGYGVYEVVDVEDGPAGLGLWAGVNGTFVVYLDEEAAKAGNAQLRHVLTLTPGDGGGPEYSFDVATGRLQILRDVQVIQITAENNCADFNIGGGALLAKVAVEAGGPLRTLTEVAVVDLANAMSTAAGVAITISYSETTHKFTVSKAAGTLQLLCNSGGNTGTSIWPLLGFDSSSDRTGSVSYTGDNPVFLSPGQHVIRCNVHGLADDAAGTYTGSANALIEKPSDQLHFVLRVLAGIPASQVDAASFVAARSAGPGLTGVLLTQEMTIADLVSWYEAAIGADLELDGGVYYLRVRDTSVPSDVLALTDSDYIEFRARYYARDHPAKVRVFWAGNYETGERWALDSDVPASGARYGLDLLEIQTAFYLSTNPFQRDARIAAIVAEAGTKRRRFAVTVKGRALILPVGAKVTLSRAKGLSTTGSLSAVLCRIVGKRDEWARSTSSLGLIEVV